MKSSAYSLRRRYRLTGLVYDILDAPWERIYRRWRPELVRDLKGIVLEAGVGTGRNLPHYYLDQRVLALDLSEVMLARARRRRHTGSAVGLIQGDAARLPLPSGSVDCYLSTFLFCVLPDDLQAIALSEAARALKPGGRFRILEIVFSKDTGKRRQQRILAPIVERVYGARFDRPTAHLIKANPELRITSMRFLKDDTYLLIEGVRRQAPPQT